MLFRISYPLLLVSCLALLSDSCFPTMYTYNVLASFTISRMLSYFAL